MKPLPGSSCSRLGAAVLSPCRRVLAACCLLSRLSRLAAAFGFESPQSPGACPGPPALAAVVRWARLGLAWRPRAQCAACGPRQRSTEAGSASAELLTLGGCSRAQPLQRICISLHATTGASRWQLVGLCLSLSLCLPPSLFFFSLFLSLSLARALASLTALLRPAHSEASRSWARRSAVGERRGSTSDTGGAVGRGARCLRTRR